MYKEKFFHFYDIMARKSIRMLKALQKKGKINEYFDEWYTEKW